MKIGIVTICDTDNLGNRLQNYALQCVLLKYADEVITLRNKPKLESFQANLRQCSPLADSPALNRILGKKRKAKLLQFNRRYIHMSKGFYWCNVPNTTIIPSDRCDFYCAGSDQIWNPLFYRQGQFNYLGFSSRDSAFSYAASFGIDHIPQQYQNDIRCGLAHMGKLSLRETEGKDVVEMLTSRRDTQVLVDPTLLLDHDSWSHIFSQPSSPLPGQYSLLYFLGKVSPERRSAVEQSARMQGCEIIDLMDPASPFYDIGPDEFLYLIDHAHTVYTDSFHGSVFSFLFHRPLVIFQRISPNGDSMGSRLKTLVNTFHLEACFAWDDQIPDLAENGNYTEGFHVLYGCRNEAFAFFDDIFLDIRV